MFYKVHSGQSCGGFLASEPDRRAGIVRTAQLPRQ